MVDPILNTARITFDTQDKGKKEDTTVIVTVRSANGNEVAKTSGEFGKFPTNELRGPFDLQVISQVKKSLLQPDGELIIKIDPEEGDRDTWRFKPLLELNYSDGSTFKHQFNEVEVDKNQNEGRVNIPSFPS